jgi:CO/xanthine dehydrogenase Mo-binding subunit
MNERVTGAIRYSLDLELPGMLHGAIVRSHSPHAVITGVELPGGLPEGCVLITPGDVADCAPYGCLVPDTPVLATTARYAGDPVAAVAARDPQIAARLARSVELAWDDLPAATDLDAALAAGAPPVHDVEEVAGRPGAWAGMRPLAGTNVCHRSRLISGRGEAGFDEAEVVVEGEWTTASAQHAPMEPHACLAEWRDGRLTVWTGTQTPFNVRRELAGTFRLPEADVRIVSLPMGGSFGAKTFTRIEAIAAALARRAGAPIKLVLSRDELFLTLNRHPTRSRVRLGATRDGRFVARRVWSQWDTGAYADTGPNVAAKGGWAAVGPYRFDHVEVDADCVYTNRPSNGAFRGYAATQAAWASEQCVDLLAERLGVDPLRLRLQNVLRDGDRFATGEIMHDFRVAECLESAARQIGWAADRRGAGLCALMKGMQTPSRAGARIELAAGRFTVHAATAEIGQGATAVLSQLAAEALGVDPRLVGTATIDTDVTPFDTRTTSSRSTHMMAAALGAAAAALRQAVADELEAAPSDLRFTQDGGVEIVGTPASRRALDELPALEGEAEHAIGGGLDPDTGQGIASAHWHQGAGAVRVAVDEETGVVEITDVAASVYAGRVVDASRAALQNDGSVVMGIGAGLYESIQFSDGYVTNANMGDYQVPAFRDIPAFAAELRESADGEIHGLGETALPLIPPALGNALQSLGLAQTHMPVHPERVLEALDRRDA